MKIGIFDSGYGGLTVFQKIQHLLPNYDYIYLGDNARTPYGTRSFEVIYDYTLQAVRKLFEMDCELIILACNTASAKALRSIQQLDLPHLDPTRRVLGVIRPSVEAVVRTSTTRNIGILATQGTVDSQSYVLEIAHLAPEMRVFQQACPMWVPLVENNEYNSSGADYFVRKYIDQLIAQCPQIDTIILACTHFPLLRKKIEQYLPPKITILEQGEIVAQSLADYLKRHTEIETKLSHNATVSFYTTESIGKFETTAKIFFDGDLNVVQAKLS